MVAKVDVEPAHWDAMFAPSSCLVIITTVDGRGNVNAASYGTCVRVCHDPMYIAFTCGTSKDTFANINATGEFVANVVPFEPAMLDKVLMCGLPFKPGIDELAKAGLTALPSRLVRSPRIAECRTHFECRVEWTRQWATRLMVCGKVEAVSIDEDCITRSGQIVWDKVKPAHYCGARYKNKFVPVFDHPTAAHWSYDGPDTEFRSDGEFPAAGDWRKAYRPIE